MSRAIVVFSDDDVHSLSFLLKPGFKHCYCLIDDGRCWILIDGLSGIPEVRAVAPSTQNMAEWCRNEGVTVIETETGDSPTPWPLAVANCVGVTKIALGIRSRAITPYQLFKHLRRSR